MTTLLHFLAQTVTEKFPDILDFGKDFAHLERAIRGISCKRGKDGTK